MNREEWREAFNACSHLLAGVAQQVAGFDRIEMEDRLLSYAVCMRDHGYDMPDPDFGSGSMFGPGAGGGPFGGLDTSDPVFKSANEVCQAAFAGMLDPAAQP